MVLVLFVFLSNFGKEFFKDLEEGQPFACLRNQMALLITIQSKWMLILNFNLTKATNLPQL